METKNIEINLLYHHPKNPRENIGDVTELAESIKANGIMQNLTVVPTDNGYHVVIGNRRLEAAKQAGLEVVPCAVVEMSEADQQAMMLTENMQRSDLNAYEEAFGMQMCLDLGMDETDLENKTGLSKRSIRNRLKMTQYGKDKVKECVARGATIKDFIDLDKIKDPKVQDNLLEYIGTPRYSSELFSALNQQDQKERIRLATEKLKTFAKKVTKVSNQYRYDCHINNVKDVHVPEQHEEDEYVFKVDSYGASLYKKRNEEELSKMNEMTLRDERFEQLKEKLTSEFSSYRKKRKAYMMDLFKQDLKERESQLVRYSALTMAMLSSSYRRNFDKKFFKSITGASINDEKNMDITTNMLLVKQLFGKFNDLNILAVTIYCVLEINTPFPCFNQRSRQYAKSDDMETLYDFIEMLGYVKSPEEEQLINGTSQIYDELKEG